MKLMLLTSLIKGNINMSFKCTYATEGKMEGYILWEHGNIKK